MITKSQLEGAVELLLGMKLKLTARLVMLPEGRVCYKQEHGKLRPYHRTDAGCKYLSRKKSGIIEGLKLKERITYALELIERDIVAMEQLIAQLVELPELIAALPEGPSPRGGASRHMNVPESWRDVVPGNPNHPLGDQITSDGTHVKSRAELAIYEFLLTLGVVFMYEKPTVINGEVWYPDFTIIRPSDGAEIIWEFFGLLNKPKYYKDSQWKLFHYAQAGFWPGVNLIVTCAYGDDSIDLRAAKHMLKALNVIE